MGTGHEEEPDEDSDEDDLWNGMETVGGRRKRIKRELAHENIKIKPDICCALGTKGSKFCIQRKIPKTS